MEILLKKIANINKKDDFGNTALHYCVDFPSAKLLIKHGADFFARNENDQIPRTRIKEWDWDRTNSDWFYLQEEKEIERRRLLKEPMPDKKWIPPALEPVEPTSWSYGHQEKRKKHSKKKWTTL